MRCRASFTLCGFSERASEKQADDVFGSHVEYTARQDRAEKVWGKCGAQSFTESFMRENEAHRQTTDEAALLIACLRDPQFIVPQDTDWHALLELAAAHGVLLLVNQAFLEYDTAVPSFVAAAVREHMDGAKKLAAALEDLLKQFAARSIEVLPLKGPVLAEALYGDVVIRSCDDLDLLVRREDLSQAERLLVDLGFAASGAADDYHHKFLRDGLLVELHFGVASPRSFPFDVDGMWARAENKRFRSAPMRVMSDGDLVLFLCLHGLKHGFSRLIWMLDVARAMRTMRDCSPEELAQRARQQGLVLALLIGCEMIREMFPQQLPQEMEAVIAKLPEETEQARRAVARLFAENAGVNNDPEIWSFYLQTESSVRQRWRRRFRFFVPTVEDYAWAERHRIYRGFVPALRPFRLLQKYGPFRAWRILFPPPV